MSEASTSCRGRREEDSIIPEIDAGKGGRLIITVTVREAIAGGKTIRFRFPCLHRQGIPILFGIPPILDSHRKPGLIIHYKIRGDNPPCTDCKGNCPGKDTDEGKLFSNAGDGFPEAFDSGEW